MFCVLKAKRPLAAVLSVTVGLSCLLLGTGAVAVLAAMDPVFNNFEKSQNGQVSAYYDNGPNAPDVPSRGIVSELVASPGVGHEGSGGAMRLSYTMDHPGETGTTGHRAMFSVANTNTGAYSSFKPQAGTGYKLTLWYKAEYLKSAADILLVQGTGNLQAAEANPPRNMVQTITRVFATETPGDWTKVSVFFTGLGNNNNVIIDLNMADHRDRTGSAVLFDDITIEEAAEEPDPVLEQDYESFEAKTYAADNDGGIHGNGSGRTVSTAYNHTPGGSKSVMLTLNQFASDNRARTVVNINGEDFKAKKNERYTVSFWVYSPEDLTYIYRIGSAGNPKNVGQYKNNNENDFIFTASDPFVELKAGVWTQITINTCPIVGTSAENVYLTIDGTFPEASTGNIKYVYIDDVSVRLADSAGDTVRIACVGDSITRGWLGWPQGGVNKGYPAQMQELIGAGYTVGNFGVDGASCLKTAGTPYWDTFAFPRSGAFSPDIVIVMLGTNDAGQATWDSDSYVRDLTDLINHYKELPSQPEVYVATAPARYGNPEMIDKTDNILVPLQKQTAAALGCPVIDINAATKNHSGLFPDGLHPNAEGYKLVAKAMAAAVAGWSESNVQNYESFEAKTYAADNDGGIHGNGSGRTVSAAYNHTPGGSKSVMLTLNQSSSDTRARTVVNFGGTDYKVERGKGYTVSFWVCSPEDITYIYRVGSIGNPKDIAQYRNNNETGLPADPSAELKAGVWTQLTLNIESVQGAPKIQAPNQGSLSADTYLTIDGTFPGASTGNIKYVYIDDVKVEDYEPADQYYGMQDYESFEAREYGAFEAGGVHGNGSGRIVTNKYNHTPGGSKSVELKMNSDMANTYAQTVAAFDGADLRWLKGGSYAITFWMMMAEDYELTWRIASTGGPLDNIGADHRIEREGKITLKAYEWKQVTVKINSVAGARGNTTYLTIGALFKGAGGSTGSATPGQAQNIKYAYVDDVEVTAVRNIPQIVFHPEAGGVTVPPQNAFAGEPFGTLPSPAREGYFLDGWYNQDGSVAYNYDSIMPDVETLHMYARWTRSPTTPYPYRSGFEADDFDTGVQPYLNDGVNENKTRMNMSGTATWLKDAGFYAETGDGSMRLENTPFVNENGSAYHAFALVNADGSRFSVVKGAKYRITYSYMGDEVNSAHSYVSAVVTPKNVTGGVGASDQVLKKNVIHGVTDWYTAEEYFCAESTGLVYMTLAARGTTTPGSSEGHVAYIDNVKIDVLDDSYVSVSFQNGGSAVGTRVGKAGTELPFPPQPTRPGQIFTAWFKDQACTQKYDSWNYPAQDMELYAAFEPADYTGASSDFSKPVTLSFEETDMLKTWLWSPDHMEWSEDVLELRTNDAKKARTGSSYIQFNAVEYHYSYRYLMFYDPNAKHNILYLDPNSTYLISYWYYAEDDFASINFDLCFNDPSGAMANRTVADKYSVSLDDLVTGEWRKVEHIVTTGEERVSVSLSNYQAPFSCALDDISVRKIRKVVLTFNSNGGTAVDSMNDVLTGLLVSEPPPEPFKDGYSFDGWYMDAALKLPFNFETMVVEDAMTLYAKWKAEEAVVRPPDKPEEPGGTGDDPSENDDQNNAVDDGAEKTGNGNRPDFLAPDPIKNAIAPPQAPDGPGKGFPWFIAGISAGAVLLLSAGLLIILRRSKKKRAGATG